jgi:NADH-quinone oxidoreductase subunit N
MSSSLTITDAFALGPLLIVLFAALALLLLEAFWSEWSKRYAAPVTAVALVLAIFAALNAPPSESPRLTQWIEFDQISRFFAVLFLSIGLACTLLAAAFFQRVQATHGEYYFLLLTSLFGLLLVGTSADFLTLFLGLETLSLSLYILCGYMKGWELSHEAAIKYFITGSVASALLVYGIALVYGGTGVTDFESIAKVYRGLSEGGDRTLFISGMILVTVGVAFKAALVPFHFWAPDVYEGAPTPVTAFMAVGTKAGAFAAFARLYFVALPHLAPKTHAVMASLAIATLVYASFVAIRQSQLRRFFAYSGISQAGFLFLPVIAATPGALQALLYYLVVYAAATLGCFAVLAHLDTRSQGVFLTDLQGLARRSPVLAFSFALFLLTLAGIPPTAGFFAKLLVLKATYEAGYLFLVVIALLTTILSAYYYLRIAATMLADDPATHQPVPTAWPAALVGATATVVIVWLSIYPEPLLQLLNMKIG